MGERMADDRNTVSVALSDDKTTLVLAIRDRDGRATAQADLGLDELFSLAAQLAEGIKRLVAELGVSIELNPGGAESIPIPVPVPKWRLVWLDTGQPVIAFESSGRLWQSFSMTADDGKKLRDGLSSGLGPPADFIDRPS